MKNKKKIIIFSVIGFFAVLLAVIILIVFTKDSKINIYEILDNMIELNSYTVEVNTIDFDDDIEGLKEENHSKVSIEGKTEKIDDHFGTTYHYNDRLVNNKEINNGNLIWYYSSMYNSGSSKINVPYYSEIYKSIFDKLKNYEYKRFLNTFEIINEEYINEFDEEWNTILDVYNDLEEEIESIYGTVNSSNFYELGSDDGWIEKVPVLDKLKISVKNNYITEIALIYVAECYTEEDEYIDCKEYDEDGEMFKLLIDFYDYNTVKVDISNDVIDSLNKTTAGDWVGEYNHTITCSNGKSYEETLTLKDSFVWIDEINEIGWESSSKLFDCDSGYYNYDTLHYYNFKDNMLFIYDIFGEKMVEFKVRDNSFLELDKNGKVIGEFKKVMP